MKDLSATAIVAILEGKALPAELKVNESLTNYFARLYLDSQSRMAQRDAQIAALEEAVRVQTANVVAANKLIQQLRGSESELLAQGVEMFGDSSYCHDEMQAAVNEFAKQLREGKA